MQTTTEQVSISLPPTHWDMLNIYADENKLTLDAAASDVLLCAVGEMMAQIDYINYLIEQNNELA
jgi:hypothetical protein